MAAAVLEAILKADKVVVFSRTVCPYCVSVKKLFTNIGVAYKEYLFSGDITNEAGTVSADKLQEYIGEQYSHYTVPVVFIKGQFIGGFDTTNALHKGGKLTELLA